MSGPSPIADPTVLYLYQVLEQLRDGSLAIPIFQRPLVWKREQQLDLLRSIRDGIPMGSILVWTTDLENLGTVQQIGEFRLAASKSPRRYLLDGLQRMSTLFSAFSDASSGDDTEAPSGEVIRFDLRENDFVFAPGDDQRPELLPLSALEDSRRLLAFQRRLAADREDWLTITDQLARSFREYKVAIINIRTDDLEAATRTFQKANSGGTKMSEAHMVHALVAGRMEFREALDAKREHVLDPLGWRDVDDEVILKTCKGLAGLDVYAGTVEQLTDAMSDQPELLDRAFEAIRRTAEYVDRIARVRSFGLVPYSMQAVLLAVTLDKFQTPNQTIEHWFWLTTYAGAFAGMSGYRTERALRDLLLTAEDGQLRWPGVRPYERTPLPRRFDYRAARARALCLMLAERAGAASLKLLNQEGKGAVRDLLPRHQAGELHASPGNRIVAPPEDLSQLRQELKSGELGSGQMAGHVITNEAIRALHDLGPEAFIRQRVEDLSRCEDELLAPHESVARELPA